MAKILITGIGGGGVGEQVLQALRLSDKTYFIVGADITPICRNIAEVDAFEIVPIANDENYVRLIIKLCFEYRVDVLIPGSEPELKVISSHVEYFENIGVKVFINPPSVLSICLDKFKTTAFLKENGFAYPRTIQIKEFENLQDIDFFPLVLKPSIGGGGSANTLIAQSKEELELFGKYLLNIYDEFIVQEYVGTPKSEFTVGVLLDYGSNLIDTILINRDILSGLSNRSKVRNLTGNASLGDLLVISSGISQGEVVNNELVKNTCESLALKIGAKGAFNIQCRVHNGKVYVFEINPRFSGTCSLRALAGFNEPDILIRKHIYKEMIQPNLIRRGHVVRGLSGKFILNQ